MNRAAVASIAWAVCLVGVIAIAMWGGRRTHNAADFFLASRRLRAWWVALSYIANASPTWLLLVVSGAAFLWGAAAVWIWLATVLAYIVNAFWIAPRLRQVAVGQGSFSIVQLLSYEAGDRLQPLIVRSAALILSFALLLEIAAVLTSATQILAATFDFDVASSAIAAIAVITGLTLAGGFWSLAFADAVQVIVVLVIATCVPCVAFAIYDPEQLRVAFAALSPAHTDWFDGRSGVVAVAFVAGVSAWGFGLSGQPHALNRFIAARDDREVARARWLLLLFAPLLLGVALLCGWSASLLYAGSAVPEQALFALIDRILPPALAACLIVLLVGALLLAIGNRLLVLASCLSADMKRSQTPMAFAWSRIVLVAYAVAALCLSLWSRPSLVDQATFAFTLMGAAFGPLILVRLSGKRVRPASTLGAMWAAVGLTVLFHALPDAPGDFLERVLPFVAALGIALTGGERRRNPDRADRAQETVHDRVPI
jgi:sodium/proline symporter